MTPTWFHVLFKFSRTNFEEGSLGFQVGGIAWAYGLLVLLVAVLVTVVTIRSRGYRSPSHRRLALGLRLAALVLLSFPLFEPVLVLPDVVPDENFVAVVVDGSLSMTLPDGREGETRLTDAVRVLGGETGVLSGLEPFFQLRTYAFGGGASRIDSLGSLEASETQTQIGDALERVLDDFRGIPLAGVVLVTDGADNGDDVPLNAAESMRAAGVPLHVVGVGSERLAPDREILDVTVGEGVEETTGAEIDVKVRSQGPETGSVDFELVRDGEVVLQVARPLKGNGLIDQFTLFYEPDVVGAQAYTLRVASATGERNEENNRIDLLVDTRKDTLQVLHFEGQPRSEFKFLKRALDDDSAVEFTSVTRTGSDKLYRQGLKRPDQLAGGFPAGVEELYGYRAVILGDVEAAFFTPAQLEMLESFVRVRGGGLLMLGGLNSFAEGDYWNTPVAELLPLEIDPSRRQVVPQRMTSGGDGDEPGFPFEPTGAGYESPILKLAADPAENRARWSAMPRLNSVNLLGALKPGAIVLAESGESGRLAREPLLVVQRYGRGRTAALPTASTWRWQMQTGVDDVGHERFWRQLVRWLVASAPGPVNVEHTQERFGPGEEIPVVVQVFDPTYQGMDEAEVRVTVTGPGADGVPVAVRPDLSEPGRYAGSFVPDQEGVFEVQAEASKGGEPVGAHRRSLIVRPSRREFRDAALQRGMLEQLASRAGGAYYAPEDAGAIPENLRDRRTARSIFRAEPLWDAPIFFLLLVGLLIAEWGLRRKRGMP